MTISLVLLVILTDASYLGFGYIIFQKDDNEQLCVVYYGGNALSSSQANYTPADLELSSLVLALKSIHWFAQHRKVTVFTDNSRVTFFHKWHPLSQRQKRMITYLQQFRLDLRYLKGVCNVSADCLSRSFDDMLFDDRVELQQEMDREDFIVTVSSPTQSRLQNATATALEPTVQRPLIVAPVSGQSGEQNQQQTQLTADGLTDGQEEIVGEANTSQPAPPQDDLSGPLGQAIDGLVNRQEQTDLLQRPEGEPADSDLMSGTLQQGLEPTQTETGETVERTEEGLQDLMEQSMQVAQEHLTSNDYYDDEGFAHMYQYLSTGDLTGIEKIDKRLLLLAEQYFIRNGLLFKLKLPRGRRDFTLTLEKLCISKLYQSQLLFRYHDWLAHGGVQKTFLSIASRFFWQSLYNDVNHKHERIR